MSEVAGRSSGRSRPRVEVGIRALAGSCGAVLVGYPVVLAGAPSRVVLMAAASAVCLVAAVARPAGALITVAAGAVAVEYALALVSEGVGLDLLAPVVAALWYLLIELLDLAAVWSRGAAPRMDVVLRRLGGMLGFSIAGGLVATTGMMVRLSLGELGVAATIAGAACLLAAMGITVGLAMRAVRGSRREQAVSPLGRSSETA